MEILKLEEGHEAFYGLIRDLGRVFSFVLSKGKVAHSCTCKGHVFHMAFCKHLKWVEKNKEEYLK